MANYRLNRTSAAASCPEAVFFFPVQSFAVKRAGMNNFGSVCRFIATAAVDNCCLRPVAVMKLFQLREGRGQRIAVIKIFFKTKSAKDYAFYFPYDEGNLIAEFVRRAGLALRNAADLRFKNAVYFIPVVFLLSDGLTGMSGCSSTSGLSFRILFLRSLRTLLTQLLSFLRAAFLNFFVFLPLLKFIFF
jgi:hypothetical protein